MASVYRTRSRKVHLARAGPVGLCLLLFPQSLSAVGYKVLLGSRVLPKERCQGKCLHICRSGCRLVSLQGTGRLKPSVRMKHDVETWKAQVAVGRRNGKIIGHMTRVTDVMCLGAGLSRGLVQEELHDWELDLSPSHGLDQGAHELQDARLMCGRISTFLRRRTLIRELRWLMEATKQAQPTGNTKEARTLIAACSMDRGPLELLVQIVHHAQGNRSAAAGTCPAAYTAHLLRGLPDKHADDSGAHDGFWRRDEPRRITAGMDHPLRPRQRSSKPEHPGIHEGVIASFRVVLHSTAKHFVLADFLRGSFAQLQEQASPARHRRLIRHHEAEQGLARTYRI